MADVTSSRRPFQILGHAAVANERSATVAGRDGRTSSRLEVDDPRRPLAHRHISDIAQFSNCLIMQISTLWVVKFVRFFAVKVCFDLCNCQNCDQVHIDDVSADDNGIDLRFVHLP